MDASSSFHAAHGPRTVPLSNASPEMVQESLINAMMGFGRQGRATMLDATDYGNYEYGDPAGLRKPASVKSLPWHDDSSAVSFVTAREYDEPVGVVGDMDLFYSVVGGGGGEESRAVTSPVRAGIEVEMEGTCMTPEAEDFYRASTPYEAWTRAREERGVGEEVVSNRPLTPYPRISSRRYATLPIPSAREREYIDSTIRSSQSQPRTFHPRYCRNDRHRNKPIPPPRLPSTYRAETPFSFDRPPTTTPFSSAGASSMSPSHRLYHAPRVGGVQMEVNALQRATEGRGAIHRALWPEEREEMLGEVDGMAGRLVRGAGVVREDVETAGKGGIVKEEGMNKEDMEKEKKEGKKFGWIKKIWGRKDKAKKEKQTVRDGAGTVVKRRATRRAEDEPLTRTDESLPARLRTFSASVQTGVHYDLPSARQEQRNFSNDTTVVAGSTPTIVADSPSPPQIVRQTKTAKRNAPSRLQKQNERRRHWWQVISRGRIGYIPKSREMLRKQSFLIVQNSQRLRARPGVVVESRAVPHVEENRESEPRRISVDDYFGCWGSEGSIRVGLVRDV